jgi:putative phosphoesterase
MIILFIADIHGITTNLGIINTINFDKLVVLGDLYIPSYYRDYPGVDNEMVKNILTKYKDKLVCMRGNNDYNITDSLFKIIDGLYEIDIDNNKFYLNHGDQDNYHRESLSDKKGVLVYGHEHIPYIKKINDMIYINVGSISLPRQGYPATYGIYQDHKFSIYDINNKLIQEVDIL